MRNGDLVVAVVMVALSSAHISDWQVMIKVIVSVLISLKLEETMFLSTRTYLMLISSEILHLSVSPCFPFKIIIF